MMPCAVIHFFSVTGKFFLADEYIRLCPLCQKVLQETDKEVAIQLQLLYTEAGKAIGFALEQPLHIVALPCSALRILKRLQHNLSFSALQFKLKPKFLLW
jgi:hypothetical protein